MIAINHARDLEQALRDIRRQRDCAAAVAKAKAVLERKFAEHERAQSKFDRVEGMNFESRIMRLLRYRLERIENGQIPG